MLETFGSIIKEEEIVTIEKGIVNNTFVLENLGAFPGYYGTDFVLQQDQPNTIFLVTVREYSAEDVFRMTHEIKKETGIMFDGSTALVTISNKNYYAIRVKLYGSFDGIADLQKYYIDRGVVFAKIKKIKGLAVINIKKIFRIEQVSDIIFKDKSNDLYYLKIDRLIDWDDFRKITAQVRHNVSLPAFDAALAVIYASDVLDLVRIYSKTITVNELTMLQQKYQEIIDRYF
jgi:hypothetical protein